MSSNKVAPAAKDADTKPGGFQDFPPNTVAIKATFAEKGCTHETQDSVMTSAYRGRKLWAQWWTPKVGTGNGIGVVFLHGIHEHSSRYTHVCEQMAIAGLHVGAPDHVGHGYSEGVRGVFGSYQNLVDDTKSFIDLCRKRWGDQVNRLVLWGQSFGGQLALQTTMAHPSVVHMLLLTSAFVDVARTWDLKLMAPIAGCIASCCPGLRVVAVVSPARMSQSAEEVERYATDPRNTQGKLTANVGHESLTMMNVLKRRAADIKCPLLMMHSPLDSVCLFSAAEDLFQKVSSRDKEFQRYELFHTMLHEDGRQIVIDCMIKWILDRTDEVH